MRRRKQKSQRLRARYRRARTATLGRRLTRVIRQHVRAAVQLIREHAVPILESPTPNKATAVEGRLSSIRDYITQELETAASRVLDDIFNLIVTKVNKSYQVSYDFNIAHTSQETRDLVEAFMIEALELIKTVPQDIIQAAEVTLLHGIGAFDRQAVMQEISHISEVSSRRAEIIANDQVAKATERYSQARAQAVGFEYYEWVTMQDARVSTGEGGHKVLDGRIYKYGEPTAIVDTKRGRGIPSTRPNCRCTSAPYPLAEGEKLKLVKDPKHGDYYVLVTK